MNFDKVYFMSIDLLWIAEIFVLTMFMLKIWVFWDATVYTLVNIYSFLHNLTLQRRKWC